MVDTVTAIDIGIDVGIALGFLLLFFLTAKVARAFSQGTLDRLFQTIALILLLFAVRESLLIAVLLDPPLDAVEFFLDIGLEMAIIAVLVVGVVRLRNVVRSLEPRSKGPAASGSKQAPASNDHVIAQILQAALADLAMIMGPSVVYGVAARTCLPILERAGRMSDVTWMKQFLPAQLLPHPAGPMETPETMV